MFRYPTPDDARGAGYAMVADRFALLLGPAAGADLAGAVWDAMTAPDAVFEDVLSVIAAIGIGRLPDFALIELVDAASSSVSVAVRGTATIDLHDPQRSSYAGGGVGTWVEGSAQHVSGISLALASAPGDGMLPLGRGVVRADALAWGADARVAPPATLDDDDDDDAADALAVGPASPRPAAPTDVDPLETVAIDRGELAEVPGPRRRSGTALAGPPQPAAPYTAEAAADAAVAADDPADDRTVLGSRRPATTAPVHEAPHAPRYVLRVAPGEQLPLERPLVLGRAPRVAEHPGARSVVVPSPRKEVSGSHLEARLDDDVLVVRDLGSTNGTVIRPPGGEGMLLRGGATARVAPGTVLDLGDGVTAVFDVLP